MNILRVANGVYPQTIGGVEVSVERLSRQQTSDGHDVTILTPEPAAPDGDPPTFCPVHHYAPGPRLFGNPLSPRPYRYVTSHADEIDVVHAHSHLFSGTVYATRAANARDLPLVVTSHGLHSQTAPWYVNRPYNTLFGRYVFRSADAVLVYTASERERLQDLGVPAERVHHVQRGIDVDACRPSYDKPTDPPHLLWVGRFVAGKGADVLVEAVAQLHERGTDARATLVGEGRERDRVEALVRERGLTDRIEFRDFVPQVDLYETYADATLFVLPSISEGMNRTVLEAMACGTPVVMSDLSQFRDLVDGCGRLVSDLDGAAFADAIEDALADDLAAMGQTARERIEGRFTWEQTFADVRPIFEAVGSE